VGAADAGTAAEPGLQRLGRWSVGWRVLLLAALVTMFGIGSVVGDDHWWPFGPWRMFSTSTPPTGAVVWMSIESREAGSTEFVPAPLTPWTVGLNRAEVEGQIPEILADPSRLGMLAHARSRLRPDLPEWTAVRLVRNEAVIVDRDPTGEVRARVVARWGTP
jgi:hypothetical protein